MEKCTIKLFDKAVLYFSFCCLFDHIHMQRSGKISGAHIILNFQRQNVSQEYHIALQSLPVS